VAGPDEIVAFAAEHGLPVAIPGGVRGGGRGLKVARTIEEIPALFEFGHPGGGRRVSAGASASSSATSTGRATSRRRCWPTATAT